MRKSKQPRAFIPRPGDQYRIVYLDGTYRKQKDFTDLQKALDFYAEQGPDRATVWTLTVSGNVKAQLDMRRPYVDQIERLEITRPVAAMERIKEQLKEWER